MAPNMDNCRYSHAFELISNTLRTTAVPALTSTTSSVIHVTARPTRRFSASMPRDKASNAFMMEMNIWKENEPRARCGGGLGMRKGLGVSGGRRRHAAPWQNRLVASARSDEHTSALQSLMRTSYAALCL